MRLFAALGFLTSIPSAPNRVFTPVQVGRALAYFPVVGLILGLILFDLDYFLSRVFPGLVANALLIAAYIALTGALHLDGWMDCCDALFGHKTIEARLCIMREPQIGAFGVAGGLSLVLVKFAALTSLAGDARVLALIVVPTLARWAIAYALFVYPYARGTTGKGSAFKEHARRIDLMIATLIAFIVAIIGANLIGVALIAMAWLIVVAVARFAIVRIEGMTGDVYGALVELIETTLWVALTIR